MVYWGIDYMEAVIMEKFWSQVFGGNYGVNYGEIQVTGGSYLFMEAV